MANLYASIVAVSPLAGTLDQTKAAPPRPSRVGGGIGPKSPAARSCP